MPEVRVCLGGEIPAHASLEEVIQVAAEAGFACLDLWAPVLSAYLATYPATLLDACLRQARVHLAAISGLEPFPLAAGERAALWQASFLEACIHLDTLGGGVIAVYPEQPGSTASPETAIAQTVRALQGASALAAPFEVRIALETPRYAHSRQVVERVGRANVGIVLDTGVHAAIEIDALDRLWLVRLREPAGAREGAGDPHNEATLLHTLCTQLAARGFKGPYSIPLPPRVPSLVQAARTAMAAAAVLHPHPR